MDKGFWLFGGVYIAFGWFFVGGADFGDEVCGGVFGEGCCFDRVWDLEEADDFAWCEAKVVFAVFFAEIAAVYIDCFGEGNDV